MNAEYFEKQRRDMLAAVRAMSGHMAAQAGKTALDERVLRVMAKVPRHEFVPFEVQQYAYLNRPIPIGFDKTISQPLMVAVMTDLLELKPDEVEAFGGSVASLVQEVTDDKRLPKAERKLRQVEHAAHLSPKGCCSISTPCCGPLLRLAFRANTAE